MSEWNKMLEQNIVEWQNGREKLNTLMALQSLSSFAIVKNSVAGIYVALISHHRLASQIHKATGNGMHRKDIGWHKYQMVRFYLHFKTGLSK